MIRIHGLVKLSRCVREASLWPANLKQNISDAPVKATAEQKFANTKLSRDYPKHGRLGDQRAAVTLRHRRSSEPATKSEILTEPSHILNRAKVIDDRYPGNEMPLWRIEKTVTSVNDRTPFEVDQLDEAKAAEVDEYRFADFEYMPPEYMIGRDAELGYLPREYEWPEETKKYFKDENVKDKKYQWDNYKHNEIEDDYMGVRRGKTRHLHASGAPIDTRYFDPNVLRLGEKWKPEELFTEEISKKIKYEELKTKYIPGYVDKQQIHRQAFPELHKDYQVIPSYCMPKLSERNIHPQGISTFTGALYLTKTVIAADSVQVEISNRIRDDEKYLTSEAKKIIQNGKLLQVDGGEYGVDPPTNVWNPLDTKFGSIDKTNMFGSHADDRSMVEETWLWDERHGLPKPERYAKAIASNLTKFLGRYAKRMNDNETISLPDEKIHVIYPTRVQGSMCYLEVHDQLLSASYSDSPTNCSTLAENHHVNEEFEIYSPTQLMNENHFYNVAAITDRNDKLAEIRKSLVSNNKPLLKSIIIFDHGTPSFDTSEHNIERFDKDRERDRKFLPILRDEITPEESKGRLATIIHSVLHDQAVREFGVCEKLPESLTATGFCITDGRVCHALKYQLNTTNLVDDHSVWNQVESYESIELFDKADHFLWDCPERIENFQSENLLKLACLIHQCH